jgi:hypothetical protein
MKSCPIKLPGDGVGSGGRGIESSKGAPDVKLIQRDATDRPVLATASSKEKARFQDQGRWRIIEVRIFAGAAWGASSGDQRKHIIIMGFA